MELPSNCDKKVNPKMNYKNKNKRLSRTDVTFLMY